MIDLEKSKEIFIEYTNGFDKSDEMINRKIEHTMNVMATSKKIAEALGLSKEEIDLATLIGLLHDIGRFQQAKKEKNFIDSENMNHAIIGAKLLFEQNKIYEFLPDTRKYDDIIKISIENHNKLKLDRQTEKVKFAKIIRDADKIDIIRLMANGNAKSMSEANNLEEVTKFTDNVLNLFYQNKCLDKKDLKTIMDKFLSTIAFVYDINFEITFEILQKSNYINQLIDAGIQVGPNQKEEFEKIREHINKYITERIAG